MEYILIQSRRKTLSLTIGPDCIVKVRSPYGITRSYIEKILIQKQSWIEKQITKYRNSDYRPFTRRYQDGEYFFYKGEKLKLETDPQCKELTINQNNILLPKVSLALRKKLLKNWYAQNTQIMVKEALKEFVGKGLKSPKSVSVTHAGKQWGSCSSLGELNFSWRLSMLPNWVLRYIVVHELSHLSHHNHSAKFWSLVACYCPDYLEAKRWIKRELPLLVF